MKYKIQYTKKKLPEGYIGMNYQAAKELRLPFKHKNPARTIVVWRNKNKRLRIRTIRHEKIEASLMRKKGWRYRRAHNMALKFEGRTDYKRLL